MRGFPEITYKVSIFSAANATSVYCSSQILNAQAYWWLLPERPHLCLRRSQGQLSVDTVHWWPCWQSSPASEAEDTSLLTVFSWCTQSCLSVADFIWYPSYNWIKSVNKTILSFVSWFKRSPSAIYISWVLSSCGAEFYPCSNWMLKPKTTFKGPDPCSSWINLGTKGLILSQHYFEW